MIFNTPVGKRRIFIKDIVVESIAEMTVHVGLYSLRDGGMSESEISDITMPMYFHGGNEPCAVGAVALTAAITQEVARRLGFDPVEAEKG